MTDADLVSAHGARPTGIDLAVLDLLQLLDLAADPAAMFRAVETTLTRLVDTDRIVIGTVDPTTRRLRIEHLHGESLGLPEHYETLPSDEQSLIHVPLTQGITVMHTLHPDRDSYRGDAMRRRHGMTHTIVAPVVARGAVLGLITLNRGGPASFSVETAAVVEAVGRILGLALLARAGDLAPDTASQVIADTLARIAVADSTGAVLDCLYRGIHRATGATVLRFERLGDGAWSFAGIAAPPDGAIAGLDADLAATAIAGALSPLVDASVGSDTIPQRAIVTDLPLDAPAPARVHPLEALPDLPGVAAIVVTPLQAAREVLGALVALWPDTLPPEMLAGHARAIFSFSDIAGPALHRLVLVHRLEQRLAETETIRRLTDSIARTPKLQDALDIICRTSRLITGVDFVAIVEVAPKHVIWHSASGARSEAFLHQRLRGPAGVLGRLLAHQQQVLLEDARHHPEFTPELMPVHTSEGLRSTAMMPVYVNARVRAALVFAWRRPHTFTATELATFHALAATAATALASADARIRADDA
jgi:GAF domain-containing protein